MRHSQHLACACRVRDCWRQRRDVQQVEAISRVLPFAALCQGAQIMHVVTLGSATPSRLKARPQSASLACGPKQHLHWCLQRTLSGSRTATGQV